MQGVAEPPAKALRTPRAAGAAGILSALPLGGAMILVRMAVPAVRSTRPPISPTPPATTPCGWL